MNEMKGRKFRKGSVLHVYQRAVDRGVIFYTLADRLVFYSTCASVMAKYGIPCYAASVMYTHTHLSCQPESMTQLDACVRDYSSSFARAYNHEHGRTGDLYDKPYGRSVKSTSKDVRSNLLYVFNNHVEKKLCRVATEERWSFLAFADSSHPFSEPLSQSTMSRRLCRALNLVDRHVAKLQPLKYSDVKKALRDLDRKETEQYVDYVIHTYGLVDFSFGKKMFGGFSNLVAATESTAGDEWEINEDFYGVSDLPYQALCRLFDKESEGPEKQQEAGKGHHMTQTETSQEGGVLSRLFQMDQNQKMGLVVECMKSVNANGFQLARFFHCDIPWK